MHGRPVTLRLQTLFTAIPVSCLKDRVFEIYRNKSAIYQRNWKFPKQHGIHSKIQICIFYVKLSTQLRRNDDVPFHG